MATPAQLSSMLRKGPLPSVDLDIVGRRLEESLRGDSDSVYGPIQFHRDMNLVWRNWKVRSSGCRYPRPQTHHTPPHTPFVVVGCRLWTVDCGLLLRHCSFVDDLPPFFSLATCNIPDVQLQGLGAVPPRGGAGERVRQAVQGVGGPAG